jgi:alkanesulfonate monooxygenase SsuD/methylene tetrahydromethanopterin reductase-like flavin-dependent oxidoreductase (luciferase family)
MFDICESSNALPHCSSKRPSPSNTNTRSFVGRYTPGGHLGRSASRIEHATIAIWQINDVRQKAKELGRDPASIATHLYHNININEDRQAALEESKKFLDIYYSTDYPMPFVEQWVAAGSPEECVEHLRVIERLGFDEVTVRITSWDQQAQLKRVMEEVLPHFA